MLQTRAAGDRQDYCREVKEAAGQLSCWEYHWRESLSGARAATGRLLKHHVQTAPTQKTQADAWLFLE